MANMNEINARKFAHDFLLEVKGKPIHKGMPTFLISRIDVVEMPDGTFQVEVIGEDENHPQEATYFLVNFLIDNQIPFNREEYGLPPLNQS